MPIYNLMLCVYYFCAIYLNMRERKIKKRVEPFLHVFPVATGLSLALAPLPFNLYNPSMTAYAWCGPVPYPYECYMYPEEVECIRGDSKVMNTAYYTMSVFSAVMISLVILLLLFVIKKVIETDRMLRKLSDQLQQKNQDVTEIQQVQNFQRNSKAAIVQASAYMLTVLLSNVPVFLLSSGAIAVLGSERERKIADNFEQMVVLLLPLQGFFNCIIFVSHKVYNYRRVHQNVSICKVLGLLLCTSAHDPTFISRISIVSHNERFGREAFQDDDVDEEDDSSENEEHNFVRVCDIEISDEGDSQQTFRLALMHCNSSLGHKDDNKDIKNDVLQTEQLRSDGESATVNTQQKPSIDSFDLDSGSMLSFPSKSTMNGGMFSLDESVLRKEEATKTYNHYKVHAL
jgi:Predicted membrane protein